MKGVLVNLTLSPFKDVAINYNFFFIHFAFGALQKGNSEYSKMLLSITSFCMSDRLNSKSFKDKEMNSGKPWSCVRFGVKKRIEMRGKFLTFFGFLAFVKNSKQIYLF